MRENYLCGVVLSGFTDGGGITERGAPAADTQAQDSSDSDSDVSSDGSTGSDGSADDEASAPEVVAAARAELVRLYSLHKPEFLGKVDGLLRRFAGIEMEFVEEVRLKYEAASGGGSADKMTTTSSADDFIAAAAFAGQREGYTSRDALLGDSTDSLLLAPCSLHLASCGFPMSQPDLSLC